MVESAKLPPSLVDWDARLKHLQVSLAEDVLRKIPAKYPLAGVRPRRFIKYASKCQANYRLNLGVGINPVLALQ